MKVVNHIFILLLVVVVYVEAVDKVKRKNTPELSKKEDDPKKEQALDLDKIIKEINSNPKKLWTAGINKRFTGLTLSDAKRMCGTQFGGKRPKTLEVAPEKTIPDSFDARDQWGSLCPSTGEIRDQSQCGSCWAFGAVEAMSDRFCIASHGRLTPHLSAQDLLSCCAGCALDGHGCNGGYNGEAWNFMKTTGVVTGGNYNGGGCCPYSFPPCDHAGDNGARPACGNVVYDAPACTQQCADHSEYLEDKFHGLTAYTVNSGVADIQTDIMHNGPVEACMTVYEDFLAYKTGVYHHVAGEILGGHAVKIIGWGVEAGSAYWTVANSWNEDWGDRGFFKILRGSQECRIEEEITAGLPSID